MTDRKPNVAELEQMARPVAKYVDPDGEVFDLSLSDLAEPYAIYHPLSGKPVYDPSIRVLAAEHSADYERAIRDVVAWLRSEGKGAVGMTEFDTYGDAADAIERGAAKGAADAERKQGGG